MIFKKEKQILKIIKYTPPIFIIVISLVFIIIQFIERNNNFEEKKLAIKSEFLHENKLDIKQRVYNVHHYLKNEIRENKKALRKSLRARINNAHTIANSIYENNKNLDEELIKKLIIDALKNIKFYESRGYFFIYDKKGRSIFHPHMKNHMGKNQLNFQNSRNEYVIRDFVSLLENKNLSMHEWYWQDPTNLGKEKKKIGVIKSFEPFDWIIGTGEYIEDFNKVVQKKALRHLNKRVYGDSGYIFVINYNGIYLNHLNKNFIGQHAYKNNDTQEIEKVIDDLIDISKKGEGYYSYIQNQKPNTNQTVKKISFVKGLEEWSWMIGTGFYEDDLEKTILERKEHLNKKFKEYVHKTINITIFLTLFLLIFSIYFSKILQEKFNNYKVEIQNHLLNNAKQQAMMSQQSKMAAMGEMIGNIAHQWRQPLSFITTTATGIRLQKDLDVLNDNFLKEGLDGINKQAQFLSSTIDDFRNFFKQDKEKNKFKICDSIEKAITLVYPQFHNMEIEIIKNIEDISIENYENEFLQVIINILNNARDEFTKKDKHFKKMIFIHVMKNKDQVQIRIKDNAGGVPKDIIERIFEPYFTTKHQTQGTGIGLYMSREIIVKNMKGNIKVINSNYSYNNLNHRGALFEITLPLSN